MVNEEPLFSWVNERHAMTLRKARLQGEKLPSWADPAGVLEVRNSLPPLSGDHPLTDDQILREYKFCAAHRELDRVTRWIADHIRQPWAEHESLWLMLAVARLLNWPPTLMELIESEGAWPGHGRAFDPRLMTAALEGLRSRGCKVETGAFMVSAGGIRDSRPWAGWSKQRYLAEAVIGGLWADRSEWARRFEEFHAMESAWRTLVADPGYEGWGPFMAFQLVLEWRHTRYLRDAEDVMSWAALGPGSRRGLNRLHGRPVRFHLSQEQGVEEMRELLEMSPRHLAPWVPSMDMEAIQAALCETDKYLRVAAGEGRPRSRYKPFRGWQ